MIEFRYSMQSQSLEPAIDSLREAASDPRGALEEVAADFRQMMTRQFETEGRAEPAAAGWPPLSASTASRKKPRSGLLVSSGALARSLAEPGAQGAVEIRDARSLTLGTRLPYAAFHQFGTRRMPARPLIVLSAARAAKWTEIVRRGIERATVLGAEELGGGKTK
jgi:phage gpG-like protein